MHVAIPLGRNVAQPEDGTTASRIAAAVMVAAIVPTAIDVKRSVLRAGVPRGEAEGDVAVGIREHRVDRPGDAAARHPRDARARGLVERRVRHHADERRVPLLDLGPVRHLVHRREQLSRRAHLAVLGARPRELATLAEHVPERVDHRERRDGLAATAARGGVADAGRGRALATQDLPHRRAGPGADPPALRHPALRRLAGGVAGVGPGPRAGVALDEVVDHRRGDDRHETSRGSVTASALLEPSHGAVGGREAECAPAGEHDRRDLAGSRERADHVGLPRSRPTTSNVHAPSRAGRCQHRGTACRAGRVRPVPDLEPVRERQRRAHRCAVGAAVLRRALRRLRRRSRCWHPGQK